MHETKTALFPSFYVDWRIDSLSSRICRRFLAGTVAFLFVGVEANAQVRTKTPDRGVYQPPLVPVRSSQPVADLASAPQTTSATDDYHRGQETELAELVRISEPEFDPNNRQVRPAKSTEDYRFADKGKRLPLMNISVEDSSGIAENSGGKANGRDLVNSLGSPNNREKTSENELAEPTRGAAVELKRVKHEEVILVQPTAPRLVDSPTVPEIEPAIRLRPREQEAQKTSQHDESIVAEPEATQYDAIEMHSIGFDGCSSCGGGCDSMACDSLACDAMGCDLLGCDSMGCRKQPWYRRWSNSGLSFRRDRWFGSAELLLLWRRGDLPAPLVTTGPDTDPDTAGELDAAETEILFPTAVLHQDMTVGGRLTLGTWLDGRQCRSLVLRGWLAGEETTHFSLDHTAQPVITRPFFNVTDNQTPAQDTQTIAFPTRSEGAIGVRASSDVYGADLSVRQFMYGKFGATVDFLYGYQFMRLSEDLRISSDAVSLDEDFAPVGSTIAIDDSFDVENEFHGAQFGLASRYRERCWSFNALAKVAFGSLARRSTLAGSTLITNGASESTDPQGLLVRNTNSGVSTDHTFGWIPEIDLSIGWQRWPCWEATFGYNIIAMTDAVRASGVIDPELAVNFSEPITGQAAPRLGRRDHTFYLQGIHFGMQYVY